MNFKLKSFSFHTHDSLLFLNESANEFLTSQSDSLEELAVSSRGYEYWHSEAISKLKNLKKLTMDGHFMLFDKQRYNDLTFLHNLRHLRLIKALTNDDFRKIDLTQLPNLQCLNVRCNDEELFVNPLENLINLKEFHIDNQSCSLFKLLASPSLKSLVISCNNRNFNGINNWTQMSQNLPNLQHLTIVNVDNFKYFIENSQKIIQVMTSCRLKTIEIHSKVNDVLKLFIENGRVLSAQAYYCHRHGYLWSKQNILENIFGNFNLTWISEEDYFEKLDFWDSFEIKAPLERLWECPGA